MGGYQYQDKEEAERVLRHVGLLATVGMVVARTAKQKQFVLERIIIELGLSVFQIRDEFGSERGEPFEIVHFLETFDERAARRKGKQ